jgi:hypothetical protein
MRTALARPCEEIFPKPGVYFKALPSMLWKKYVR